MESHATSTSFFFFFFWAIKQAAAPFHIIPNIGLSSRNYDPTVGTRVAAGCDKIDANANALAHQQKNTAIKLSVP